VITWLDPAGKMQRIKVLKVAYHGAGWNPGPSAA